MNVVVTIFYSLCLAWCVGLGVFAIIKRIKMKKQTKEVKKEVEVLDERKEETKTDK